MKYEITSLNTKKLFAEALKKIILQKSFSKVTVSELIRECGVNRKTFYYHFSDVYDLLKWTLEQEAIDVVKNFDLIVDYEEAILFVIEYIKVNNKFLNNIYDSLGRDELKRFFYTDFVGIVEIIIGKAEEETHKKLTDNFKKFLAAFYTEAIAGTLVEVGLEKIEPEKIEEIIKEGKRENAGKTLPPNGLYLVDVKYE